MLKALALQTALLAGVAVTPSIALAQGDRIQVGFGAFHAAALTTSRAAGDSTDSPFLLVSVVRAGVARDTIISGSGPLVIRLNGTIPPRALTELTLDATDSAYIEVSVLEHGDPAAYARMTARDGGAIAKDDPAARRIAPMVRDGAHHIGTVRLHVARTGGVTYWRRLECAATCSILGGPTDVPLAQPVAGVAELTGAGGTYHLQLRAARTP